MLNVIEEPRERIETLRRAFSFASVCLSVAVMIDGKGDTTSLRAVADGIDHKPGWIRGIEPAGSEQSMHAMGMLQKAAGK